jgi:hypothetical protein
MLELLQIERHQRFFAESWVGIRGPFFLDDALLLLGQPYMNPSHGVFLALSLDLREHPGWRSH